MNSQTDVFQPAVGKFLANYCKLKTNAARASALSTFANSNEVRPTSKKIGVQPTATNRRVYELGGRPPKASRVSEHGYHTAKKRIASVPLSSQVLLPNKNYEKKINLKEIFDQSFGFLKTQPREAIFMRIQDTANTDSEAFVKALEKYMIEQGGGWKNE